MQINKVMMYKAYKYRLYPNKSQEELILKHIGCCRYIYNYGLDRKIKTYQESKQGLSRFEIQSDLVLLKKQDETSWLKEVNSLSLQASLANLDMAFTRFFKEKKGFPKFKSKKVGNQSFQVVQNTKVDFENNKVFLPKFKYGIKCKFHRIFEGDIKTSTISKTPTGKYFISILVKVDKDLPKKKPIDEKQAVGVDLGIKTFATLSDGIEIENPKNLRKSIRKLKRFQRSLSRKQKESNNRKKSVRLLAIQHEKVTNRRNDFLNKTSKFLIDSYDTICLETLSSKNMMQNHRIAQALSDVAISKFNEMMDYKAELYGKNIVRIGRFEPSSKMCECGNIYRDLKLSDRVWKCPSCGRINQRDLLAANNIKKFAFCKNNTVGTTEINACGDMNLVTDSAQEAHKYLVYG